MIEHLELPPQDQLLKPRDHAPILWVPPQTWNCLFCEPDGRKGAGTTVEWVGPRVGGADGRCRECGQKYGLGTYSNPRCYPALDDQADDPAAAWPYKHRWWARGAA